MYDPELLELGESLGLDEFRRDDIISALMRIPWGANEESMIISEFLGVQSWVLELHDGESLPPRSLFWLCKYHKLIEEDNESEYQNQLAGRKPFKRLSYQNPLF